MEFWRLSFPLIDRYDHVVTGTASQGWDGLALGDSTLIAGDVYGYSGFALAEQPALRIETCVTNLVLRDPRMVAAAAATLWRMSGGRFDLGVGRGDSALHLLGIPPPSFDTFAASIEQLSDALVEQGVRPGEGPTLEISASGPRVAKLAARATDGVILAMGTSPEVLGPLIQELRAEREAAGRDGLRITVLLPIGVDTPDLPGHEIIRGSVATFANIAVRGRVRFLSAYFTEERADELREAYEYQGHSHATAKHAEVLTAEEIGRYGVVGSVERCAERIRELRDLGVDRVIVIGGSRDEYDRRMRNEATVLTEVAPLVR